ncbi:hypothetical protein Pmani_018914 [Petrolisthes manimaculis]|uniref:Uncharacterized protein n=1 Tax=Petrolisthes manimaculis TaxID=1843537 RepID=A0AAE1PKM4_9EUCA|nr:hypothetical protein Pmani_018914 [Petrolisthes manimaculis]
MKGQYGGRVVVVGLDEMVTRGEDPVDRRGVTENRWAVRGSVSSITPFLSSSHTPSFSVSPLLLSPI